MVTLRLVKTGRRAKKKEGMTSSRVVYNATKEMAGFDREHFVVLHLDGKNRIVAKETVSIGHLTESLVHPREVFKAAVMHGSAAIIAVHNHPTGDPTPSRQDREVTSRLSEVGELVGIKLLDHVIIGDGEYVSMADEGILN